MNSDIGFDVKSKLRNRSIMHQVEITHFIQELDIRVLEKLLHSNEFLLGKFNFEETSEFSRFSLMSDDNTANENQLKLVIVQRNRKSNNLTSLEDLASREICDVVAAFLQLPKLKVDFKESVERKLRASNYLITIVASNLDDGYLDFLSNLIGNFLNSFDIRNLIGFLNSEGYWCMHNGSEMCYDSKGDGDQFPLTIESNSIYPAHPINPDEVESIERKLNSYRKLGTHSLRSNPSLPLWINKKEMNLKNVEEVWERIWALWSLLLAAGNQEKSDVILNYLKEHHISHVLSPKELEFLLSPSDETASMLSWRWECLVVLYWSIGVIDELTFPPMEFNLNSLPEAAPYYLDSNPFQFLPQYRELRSPQEILEQADLYYRSNWIARDSMIRPRPLTNFNPSVAYERFYAFNWLIGLDDSPWDEVQTPS